MSEVGYHHHHSKFYDDFPVCFEGHANRVRQSVKNKTKTTIPFITEQDIQLENELQNFNDNFFLKKGYHKGYNSDVIIKYYPISKEYELETPFLNEKKVIGINHRNVIKNYKTQNKVLRKKDNRATRSCMMEYAPFGNFATVIKKHGIGYNDILVRTYFHQLIEGLVELHRNEIAHLDIKTANLLLGSDYQLKICDFNISAKIGSKESLYGLGTQDYRAPELMANKCTDLVKADIYSAGVVLFEFKFGYKPYREDNIDDKNGHYQQLQNNPKSFWARIEQLDERKYDENFKELIEGMLREDPVSRYSIDQVKENKWYKGETYDDENFLEIMKFNIV